MKEILLLLTLSGFIFTASHSVSAQNVPSKQWDKTFGGNEHDDFRVLQQTTDQGYILGGNSPSGISGNKTAPKKGGEDFWVIKLDVLGNKQWDKTFGGNSYDYLSSIQQTRDGGYILGGQSNSLISFDKSEDPKGGAAPPYYTTGYSDFWLIKLDSVGNKMWDKTLGGSNNDDLSIVLQTTDGGYILGGISESGIGYDKSQTSQGDTDIWIIKVDGNGNKLWDKTFGGANKDYLNSLRQTSDGGFIFGAASNSGISSDKSQPAIGDYDYWIIKTDSLGNKIWDRTLGSIAEDWLSDIQQTSDGNYVLGGSSKSGVNGDKSQPSFGNADFWIVKVNANGIKIWDKTYGGADADLPSCLEKTPDGGYVLGGYSHSGISGSKTEPSRGWYDLWMIKVDSFGNKLWDKTIGGSLQDGIGTKSLKPTQDGGYIIGGFSDSPVSGEKTSPPFTFSNGNNTIDYWIVKLEPDITGRNEDEINFTVSISPNPNTGIFNLQLNDLNTSAVEIKVTDLLGKVVLLKDLQVLNKQISEEVTLPVSMGMYLLQIKTGNRIITRKILVD